MNEEKENLNLLKKKYYGKLFLYILVISYGLAVVVKLLTFILMGSSVEASPYRIGRFIDEFGSYRLVLDTIFVPISYYALVRFLKHINKREEF